MSRSKYHSKWTDTILHPVDTEYYNRLPYKRFSSIFHSLLNNRDSVGSVFNQKKKSDIKFLREKLKVTNRSTFYIIFRWFAFDKRYYIYRIRKKKMYRNMKNIGKSLFEIILPDYIFLYNNLLLACKHRSKSSRNMNVSKIMIREFMVPQFFIKYRNKYTTDKTNI